MPKMVEKQICPGQGNKFTIREFLVIMDITQKGGH